MSTISPSPWNVVLLEKTRLNQFSTHCTESNKIFIGKCSLVVRRRRWITWNLSLMTFIYISTRNVSWVYFPRKVCMRCVPREKASERASKLLQPLRRKSNLKSRKSRFIIKLELSQRTSCSQTFQDDFIESLSWKLSPWPLSHFNRRAE